MRNILICCVAFENAQLDVNRYENFVKKKEKEHHPGTTPIITLQF